MIKNAESKLVPRPIPKKYLVDVVRSLHPHLRSRKKIFIEESLPFFAARQHSAEMRNFSDLGITKSLEYCLADAARLGVYQL